MTTPTILPTQYTGTYKDFLHTKVDKQGVVRCQSTQVSVPTGTTTTTIVGLAPFNAGDRLLVDGSAFACDALGSGVTISLGVVYDDNVNNTNNATLFASALTAAAAGGALAVTNSTANIPYVTTGNGWIAATIGGATTGTTNSIFSQVVTCYDGLQASN